MQSAYDKERGEWREQRQTMKDSLEHTVYVSSSSKLHEKSSYRRQSEQQTLKLDELEAANRRQQAEIELLIVSFLLQLLRNHALRRAETKRGCYLDDYYRQRANPRQRRNDRAAESGKRAAATTIGASVAGRGQL